MVFLLLPKSESFLEIQGTKPEVDIYSLSYEALKYYLVLVAINLIMLAFYLGAF